MKIRVLHVIDSLALGGAQEVVRNLVRAQIRQGLSVEVACLHGHGVMWDRVASLGAPVHSLARGKFSPGLPIRLWRLVSAGAFDVVHAHLFGSGLLAGLAARLAGVRARIYHDHCNDRAGLPFPMRILDRRIGALFTRVIAVSSSVREKWLQDGAAPGLVSTVLNGVDTDEFRPAPTSRAAARRALGLPADGLVVGGVGRLTAQKNFALFLSIAARIRRSRPDIHFAIAGTGPEDASLRETAARLGVADGVTFLGFVNGTSALYPAFDALLMTSRYEGLPMTLLEAMACGVPAVAPALDGILEVMRDGKGGLLAPPGDEDALAESLRRLLEDPALRDSTGASGAQTVRQDYSCEAMARLVGEIYQSCLDSDRHGK